MPELPEVRTVVKDLNEKVTNKTISNVMVFMPKLIKNSNSNNFKKMLIGKKIKKIKNVGKFIVFEFSSNVFLVSHLRMEGKYHTKEWENSKHDHISFIFEDKTSLIYNDSRQFGTFHIFDKEPYNLKPLNKLGKEPGEIEASYLYERLQNKNIAIKTALLDQTLLVGLGNIYVNEVLWEVKIDPTRSCRSISFTEIKKIIDVSKKIMDESTKLGGSSIDSYSSLDKKQGQFQNLLKVHKKENMPCVRCKDSISKIKVNGRGTYYCASCQK